MSRMRIKSNRREIKKLISAAVHQISIISDADTSEPKRAEAAQRLAEIRLRIGLLKDENERL